MTQQINTTRGTSSPQKKDYQTIFVYGSLRKGMGLNPVLTSSEYLGTVTTEPKYTMYDLGAFPCITEQGETSLVGDLYIVNSDVLSQLDVIESVPNLYDRKEISSINARTNRRNSNLLRYISDLEPSRLFNRWRHGSCTDRGGIGKQ